MSEYWKSTERYWCKHCKLFVKDTKIERQNHDATPRHQGNLKRFVKDLHKNNERDEREKQRAKDEVARLNGVVGGGSGPSRSGSTHYANGPTGASKARGQSSQKDQLQQLVDLGVNLPDEFRKELSMTGQWQTVSERLIEPAADNKQPDAIGFGVRKRENPEDDEEEEVKETKRQRWESTHKTHIPEEDDDLEALLNKDFSRAKQSEISKVKEEVTIKTGDSDATPQPKSGTQEGSCGFTVKTEPSDAPMLPPLVDEHPKVAVKEADGVATGGVVFKKRAKKNIRQR